MSANHTITIIAMLCLVSAPVALAQHTQDEPKQRVLTQAQSISPDDYAFTRTIRSEGTSNGKPEQHVNVDKFDPTKPAEARWTLVSVDGAPPTADAMKHFGRLFRNAVCSATTALQITSGRRQLLRQTHVAGRCFILPPCRKTP